MNTVLFYISESLFIKQAIHIINMLMLSNFRIIVNDISSFFFDAKLDVWQGLFWGSLIIPITTTAFRYLFKWINSKKPLKMLLSDFIKKDKTVIVYLSQLSVSQGLNKINNPSFISYYPAPTPTNIKNLGSRGYVNIDPLWSESDGKCATSVINLLGRAGSKNNFVIADLISDWNNIDSPIITVGFNPKTNNLMPLCNPIFFKVDNNYSDLTIKGHDLTITTTVSDYGIIQKTSTIHTNQKVLILAGAGTGGTELSGYILNKYSIELGKLYGRNDFCLVFTTNRNISSKHYELIGLYPYPLFYNRIRYFWTYTKWLKKNIFPKK
ncbi:MAG: hypothetical protein K2X26_09230 [Chitinophagaceae bacterium]|nr:hypothetical protein [Chitinophagaceae bacterium]